MSFSQKLVVNDWFQLVYLFTVIVAFSANVAGIFFARMDGKFGRSSLYIFLPKAFMAGIYMFFYSLQVFDIISRPEYLDIIAPLAPMVFLFVWPNSSLTYMTGHKERKKIISEHDG